MRRLAFLFVVVTAVSGACGGSKHGGSGEPVASRQWQDGPPPTDAAPAQGKLSEAECTTLLDHIAKLMEEGMPPDEWKAGKDDLAADRARLIKECQEGETTRAQYNCLIRVEQLNGVKDCVPQK